MSGTVKIDRYVSVLHGQNGHIMDLKHDENIVIVKTRNRVLAELLLARCLDCLNEGVEFND